MTVRLPQLWGVLYAGPNRDGARKACGNCRHASADVTACAVVDAPISPAMVCGYHVEAGAKSPPDLAGLEEAPGGTSCDRCEYFRPLFAPGGDMRTESGACVAVANMGGEPPVLVSARGCCARWQAAGAGGA